MRLIALILVSIMLFGCATTQNGADRQQNTTQIIPVVRCADVCGSGGPQACGTDGRTYANKCEAECAGTNVAAAGACAVVADGCTDTDSGSYAYAKGTAKTSSQTSTDRCKGAGEVYEYYCEDGSIKNQTIQCPSGYGCSDGACVLIGGGTNGNCVDSDGKDITIAGVTTAFGKTYSDACNDAQLVKEYYCEGGEAKSAMMQCDPGQRCVEGRCLKTQSACTETDSGKDIYQAGTLNINSLLTNAEYLDKCLDASTLKEYYCTGDAYTSENIQCPKGTTCAQAACKEPTCTDTDDGFSIYIKGVVNKGSDSFEDNCTDGHNGIEYYCEGNQVKSSSFSCPGGYVCRSGECKK